MKKEKLRKQLRFECPQCGGAKLDLVYDCLTAFQEVKEVHEDATVYVNGPIQIVEDHGHWYRCHDCETSLVDWDKEDAIWRDDSLLVDWLLENCPQDERELNVEPDETQRRRIAIARIFQHETTSPGAAVMAEALRVAMKWMKNMTEISGEDS